VHAVRKLLSASPSLPREYRVLLSLIPTRRWPHPKSYGRGSDLVIALCPKSLLAITWIRDEW
jgi:hypothetical protein